MDRSDIYVSFVVPVYNQKEEYLSRCISSIKAYDKYPSQIIIVDDGSDKEHAALCDNVASRFGASVYHRDNEGISSARNFGLEAAEGTWVQFVDSDDWIDTDELSKLDLDSFEEDVIILNAFQIRPDGQKKIHSVPDIPEGPVDNEGKKYLLLEAIADGFKENRTMSMVLAVTSKVFRRSFLTDNGLSFNTGLKIAEDSLLTMTYLSRSDTKIRYHALTEYFRFVNVDSVMHSYSSYIKTNDKIFTDALNDLFGDTSDPLIKEALNKRFCLCALGVMMFDMANPANPKSAKVRSAELKEFVRHPLYRDAIKKADLKRFGRKNKLRLILLRLKMEGLAIKI